MLILHTLLHLKQISKVVQTNAMWKSQENEQD